VSHFTKTVRRLPLVTLFVYKGSLMALQGFAERLRAARAAASLTQEQVASALGYQATTIGNWDRARTEPCATDLARLATLYRVSADWLLTGQARLPHRFERRDGATCPHDVPITDRCIACEYPEGIAK